MLMVFFEMGLWNVERHVVKQCKTWKIVHSINCGQSIVFRQPRRWKISVGGIPHSKEVCIYKVDINYHLFFALASFDSQCNLKQALWQSTKVYFQTTKLDFQFTKAYIFSKSTRKLSKYKNIFSKYTSTLSKYKIILQSTKSDFQSTKADFQSTKVYFQSTRVYFQRTKALFQSTK